MAKNGNLRVGHGTGGAACQAGDGAAQRSGGRAEGRSGSIKKTEIIKIMILLSLVRIAMRCKPSWAGPVRAAQGRVILTRAHAAIAARPFFQNRLLQQILRAQTVNCESCSHSTLFIAPGTRDAAMLLIGNLWRSSVEPANPRISRHISPSPMWSHNRIHGRGREHVLH